MIAVLYILAVAGWWGSVYLLNGQPLFFLFASKFVLIPLLLIIMFICDPGSMPRIAYIYALAAAITGYFLTTKHSDWTKNQVILSAAINTFVIVLAFDPSFLGLDVRS